MIKRNNTQPEKLLLPNLLLIAGSGQNTGKTTLACHILQKFSNDFDLIGLKTSPHFHLPTEGLQPVKITRNYKIYRELNPNTSKDSSRMLRAGALRVYLFMVTDIGLNPCFKWFLKNEYSGMPIVCESTSLAERVESGLTFYLENKNKKGGKSFSGSSSNIIKLHSNEQQLYPEISKMIFLKGKWILSE